MSDAYIRQLESLKQVLLASGLGEIVEPDESAIKRHKELYAIIIDRIQQGGGQISFADYMHAALYEPGLGYYVSGLRKFGEGGDFVTAPEISPLFAQCLGNQVQQVYRILEKQGTALTILEFGPGTGILAATLLEYLQQINCLPEKYYMLEVSPTLMQRQKQTLMESNPEWLHRVQWLQALPKSFSGIVIANEVLDAMPVEVFQFTANAPEQACIGIDSEDPDQLSWCTQALTGDLAKRVAMLGDQCGPSFVDGYRSEVNLWIDPWIKSIADIIDTGLVMLIDYGYPRREYYHAERTSGTLMCYFQHRAHDNALLLPGLQDITAYVDFTAVALAAVAADMTVAGFVPQAQFLLGCGLDRLLSKQMQQDPVAQAALSQQVKRLTMPGEMGERFKVLGLSKQIDEPLIGFSIADQTHKL